MQVKQDQTQQLETGKKGKKKILDESLSMVENMGPHLSL